MCSISADFIVLFQVFPLLSTSEDTASTEWGVRTEWSMSDGGHGLEFCQKVRMQGKRGGKEGTMRGDLMHCKSPKNVLTAFPMDCHCLQPTCNLVLEPDPSKIVRRVWEIGWDGSVPSGMYGICNY